MTPSYAIPLRSHSLAPFACLCLTLVLSVGCDDVGSREVTVTGGIFSREELDAAKAAQSIQSPTATLADVRAVALAYTQFWVSDLKGEGPGSIGDLDPFLRSDPRVVDLVRSGELIVLWHATLKDMPKGVSQTVLAYGRRTPIQGGPVAFADTNTREVDAQEFGKLPRASIEQ